MPTKIWAAALVGLDAVLVEVEADSGGGDFGQIKIVGLPDPTIKESTERVRSVLRHCGLDFPRRRITISLAPAEIRKQGPAYDLPIALSILALKHKLKISLTDSLVIGELSLNGEIKPIKGALAIAITAKKQGVKKLFLPTANAAEASLAGDIAVFPVTNFSQALNHFFGREKISPFISNQTPLPVKSNLNRFPQVIGQPAALRAAVIAASGGHNLLLSGPPGSGKTMIANVLSEILPPLSREEWLEVIKIRSISNQLTNIIGLGRPFRSPHHSLSVSTLIGGGNQPRPGEISLAHRGVLFLDELPELSRSCLESLRQPLEEGQITITRSASSISFPCRFLLVGAMNLCPCGYFGNNKKTCLCRPQQITAYRQRVSGPILDRFDLHAGLSPVDINKLQKESDRNTDLLTAQKVADARLRQSIRFRGLGFNTNSELDNQGTRLHCRLSEKAKKLLSSAGDTLNITARAYFKILKISLTIADLNNEETISADSLAEALQYRPRLD